MLVRVLARVVARVRRLPLRVRLRARQVLPRCIPSRPHDTRHRTPVGGHARAYVESAQPPGALAFAWTCVGQAALESTKARGTLATESVPVPEQVATRVQRLWVARVVQPSAPSERALAPAPVRGKTLYQARSLTERDATLLF